MVALVMLVAYLFGCCETGYYLVLHRTGLDIRTTGSGGTGATNAGRALGRQGFALVLLGDMLKGALAVGLAMCVADAPYVQALAATCATAGHIWPVQLGFRGGRGIAVGMGALLVYSPTLLLMAVLCAAAGGVIIRSQRLGGLMGVVTLPLFAAILHKGALETASLFVLVVIILIAHRERIPEWFMATRGGKELEDA